MVLRNRCGNIYLPKVMVLVFLGGTQLSELFVNDHPKSLTIANDVMLNNDPQNSNLFSWQNDGSVLTQSYQKSKILSNLKKSNSASLALTHTITNRHQAAAVSLPHTTGKNQRNVSLINQNCNKTTQNMASASVSTLQTTQPLTLKVPIQTSLGKSLHLHLIAKEVTSVAPNQQVTNTIPFSSLQPTSTQPRTSSLVLLKDKATGKTFLVPSGSPLIVAQTHPVAVQTLDNQPTVPPEGLLPEVPSTFEGMDILDPQPVLDVNEFLNIPPKVTQTENNVKVQEKNSSRIGSEGYVEGNVNNSQSVSSQNISIGGNQPELETGLFSEKGESTDIDLQTTGEDLIKLMAVKISDRKIDETMMQKETDKQYLFHEDSDSSEKAGSYEVGLVCDSNKEQGSQTAKPTTNEQPAKEEKQMDSSISETEERIASIVPDSMRVILL